MGEPTAVAVGGEDGLQAEIDDLERRLEDRRAALADLQRRKAIEASPLAEGDVLRHPHTGQAWEVVEVEALMDDRGPMFEVTVIQRGSLDGRPVWEIAK
jgi:hypothetical protein